MRYEDWRPPRKPMSPETREKLRKLIDKLRAKRLAKGQVNATK